MTLLRNFETLDAVDVRILESELNEILHAIALSKVASFEEYRNLAYPKPITLTQLGGLITMAQKYLDGYTADDEE
jgi:hypothetical protein